MFSNYCTAALGRRFALFLLCCNLLVCSIPRCDFAQAAVQDIATLWQAEASALQGMSHCHGKAKAEDQGLATLGEPELCHCELLRFLCTLPLEPTRSVTRPHHNFLAWDLVHSPQQSLSDFIPDIEPPYPEA